MKTNEKFFTDVLDYVINGNGREQAMDRIYKTIDNINWRIYVRELYARTKGVATPEQNSRWNAAMEEILFRAVQW